MQYTLNRIIISDITYNTLASSKAPVIYIYIEKDKDGHISYLVTRTAAKDIYFNTYKEAVNYAMKKQKQHLDYNHKEFLKILK